jgi:hypothetical protein
VSASGVILRHIQKMSLIFSVKRRKESTEDVTYVSPATERRKLNGEINIHTL